MRHPLPLALTIALAAAGSVRAADPPEPLARLSPVELSRLAADVPGASLDEASPLGGPALVVPATPPGQAIRLPGSLPWSRARHLALDALVPGRTTGEVLVRFFAAGETEPRLSASLGLFPGLRTRLSLPLAVLDGQTIFLPRTPGRMKAVVTGRRIAAADVDHVELQLKLTAVPQTLAVGGLWLVEGEPEHPLAQAPLVDALGQWNGKDWPGRTRDEAQLRKDLGAALEAARRASYPEGWSAYGGTKAKRSAATGFFRAQRDGGRWWLVDPEGCGFFSLGLDSVRPGETAAIVPGAEALFGALPPREGAFAAAWGEGRGRWNARTFSFGLANLIRAFGSDWRARWTELTRGRLVAWRFNTVANWSDAEFQAARPRLPYVVPMPEYPGTKTLLYRDFPDVFDPSFRESAARYAAALERYRDDPSLVGYFMRNEPNWAFGANNVAAEMLEANPGTATRRELARWLAARYHGDAAAWARAWGLGLRAFDEVGTALVPRAAERSPAAKDDLWEFSKEMVRAYVRIPAEACRRVDPRHLNLGMRYAWISSELLYEASDAFDVFTINAYAMTPPADVVREIAARTGKPVLIGEYHFGALDRGLPSTGLRAVESQEERGVAYRRYVEAAAADPNVVGAHYFVLNDQEALGRFDGENFQIGFVDVCHRPYDELVGAAIRSHEAIYDVMLGRTPPSAREAREVPRVGF
ncbi:MAG: beta-galactosidase [Vicinamibacteria bacterium]